MTDIISKLGFSGGVGFLLGFLLVWWVEPDTHQGIAFLVGAATVVCVVAGELISRLLRISAVQRRFTSPQAAKKRFIWGSDEDKGG